LGDTWENGDDTELLKLFSWQFLVKAVAIRKIAEAVSI
jgi:hypothetical protein